MPYFISKLQYKTCEKGEYYDEQPRNLEQTIALIKSYPWYREQYADIELTGPSITIKDKQDNYLKIGIYYGGRLTLYYLFNNVLYTRFNLGYEEVIPAVEHLFSGNLGLDGFNKTLYNIGKKGYFVTKDFTYRITFPKILIRLFYFLLITVFVAFLSAFSLFTQPVESALIPTILFLILAYFSFRFINSILKRKKQVLQISRGNDLFVFTDEHNIQKEFNKSDIKQFNRYISTNSRNPVEIEFFEFNFKDGSNIFFSNALISFDQLEEKFSKHWKLESVTEKTNITGLLLNQNQF